MCEMYARGCYLSVARGCFDFAEDCILSLILYKIITHLLPSSFCRKKLYLNKIYNNMQIFVKTLTGKYNINSDMGCLHCLPLIITSLMYSRIFFNSPPPTNHYHDIIISTALHLHNMLLIT